MWHVNSLAAAAELLQSCPTLCNPIDGSPPGSPVPGILQARTLEWAAISFSSASPSIVQAQVGLNLLIPLIQIKALDFRLKS